MTKELVQKFKTYLEEKGKSSNTVESYVGDTLAFVTFLEGKVSELCDIKIKNKEETAISYLKEGNFSVQGNRDTYPEFGTLFGIQAFGISSVY